MRTTLARRVVRLTTASIVVIMVIFGYFGYRTTSGIAKTEVIRRQQDATAATMSSIERMLAKAMQDLQILAEYSGTGHWREMGLDGHDPSLEARHPRQFARMVHLGSRWDQVVVVDRTGTIVISVDEREIGQTILDDANVREVFQAAMSGRMTHSDVYPRKRTQQRSLVLGAPILRDAGDPSSILGVALGWFALPVLDQLLDEVPLPSVPRLLNAQGLTIATRSNALSEILRLRIDPLVSVPDVVRTSHVQKTLGAYQASGWRMVFDTSSRSAYAPVRERDAWMAMGPAALLLCLIAAGYILARYFARPIETLTAAVAGVSEGDLESHVVMRTGDEIERLGDAFNEMVDRLKKQIAEREQSEQRFILASRATNDVIFEWNLSTNACWVNEAWQTRFLNPTWGEVDNSVWSDSLHPDDRDRVMRRIQAAIQSSSQFWEDEYRCIRGDGSQADVLSRGYIVRTEAGQPLRMVGATTDITERKRVEEDLRSSRELLRSTLDSIPEIVAVKSTKDFRFVMANRQALGIGPAVIGRTDYEVFPRETADLMHADDLLVMKTRAGSPTVTRVHSLVGKTRSFKESRMPLLDAHGEVEFILVVAEDVTERIMQDELRRQKSDAEAANAAKSEFLARMSHEIRTPMNGVIGMSSLLRDTRLTADQREYAETIHSSGIALLAIINDVLDLSRIESGKLVLEAAPFSLRKTVSDSAKVLAVAAAQKSIELVVDIDPEVPDALVGDSSRLRQMILNLAGNAVKFTDRGEIVISAAMDASPGASSTLHFSIRDTGVGIPLDQIDRMFESFEQLDSSDTRNHGGTGLGLAITRRLAEMMGGRVWAESEPGSGSTFHFTARFETEKSQTSSSTELQGRRVLLIEENASARTATRRMLEAHGAQVVASASHDDAGPLQNFDYLIIDSVLAEDEGGATIDRALSQGMSPDQIVILLSATQLQTGARQIASFGVKRSLVKPVVEQKLIAILQQKAGVASVPAAGLDKVAPVRPLRILVAEDNLVNQRVAVRFLERDGHAAIVVSNGREAVSEFQRQSFDVILMDVQMPEMDGLTATREIRNLERALRFHTPIIALTAHSVSGDRERCLAAGMNGYVSKPIKAGDLRDVIAAVMPGHGVEAA